MEFSIAFDAPAQDSQDDSPFLGLIIFDETKEWFHSANSFWDRQQYQTHWMQAVKRLLDGHQKSALITDITTVSEEDYLVWWPMWNVKGQIHIQNQLLFLSELGTPFDISRYYDFVGERETVSEDGDLLSEWTTTMDALSHFWIASQ